MAINPHDGILIWPVCNMPKRASTSPLQSPVKSAWPCRRRLNLNVAWRTQEWITHKDTSISATEHNTIHPIDSQAAPFSHTRPKSGLCICIGQISGVIYCRQESSLVNDRIITHVSHVILCMLLHALDQSLSPSAPSSSSLAAKVGGGSAALLKVGEGGAASLKVGGGGAVVAKIFGGGDAVAVALAGLLDISGAGG